MQTDPLEDTSRDNFPTQTQIHPMFDTMKLWIYYEPGSEVPAVSFFIFINLNLRDSFVTE